MNYVTTNTPAYLKDTHYFSTFKECLSKNMDVKNSSKNAKQTEVAEDVIQVILRTAQTVSTR